MLRSTATKHLTIERAGNSGSTAQQYGRDPSVSPQDKLEVDVLATFTAAGVRPLALRMGGRRYEPLHVHLTHTVREGRKLWRVFSVTDGPPSAPESGNAFTLAFDPEECRWRLWESVV
ncbi:MAG: hypothetical protein Q7R80_03850 [bacterium]|nr:hypothetical protein [bacterium]